MTDPRIAPEAPDSAQRLPVRPAAWSLRDVLTVLGLTVIVLVLIYTAAGLVIDAAGIRGHQGQLLGAGLVATLIFEFCLVGLALGFSVGKYGVSRRDFGFASFPSWGWALPFVGIAGSYVILLVYIGMVSALGLHRLLPTSNVPSGLFDSRDLIPFAGVEICLVAPIAEESFFRGFLFRGLLGKWVGMPGSTLRYRLGFWGAAIPSGLLFAAFHAQLGLIIPFTGVGVLFAWIFWRSGSLWPNILTHAGFNLISFAASLAMHH